MNRKKEALQEMEKLEASIKRNQAAREEWSSHLTLIRQKVL